MIHNYKFNDYLNNEHSDWKFETSNLINYRLGRYQLEDWKLHKIWQIIVPGDCNSQSNSDTKVHLKSYFKHLFLTTTVTHNKKLQTTKYIHVLLWVYFSVLNTYEYFLCAHLVVKLCSMSAEHKTINTFILNQCKISLPDLDNIQWNLKSVAKCLT